jgi:hypothetical protein
VYSLSLKLKLNVQTKHLTFKHLIPEVNVGLFFAYLEVEEEITVYFINNVDIQFSLTIPTRMYNEHKQFIIFLQTTATILKYLFLIILIIYCFIIIILIIYSIISYYLL